MAKYRNYIEVRSIFGIFETINGGDFEKVETRIPEE